MSDTPEPEIPERAPLDFTPKYRLTEPVFNDTLTVVRRSGVAPVLEKLTRGRRGPKNKLMTAEAMCFSLLAIATLKGHQMHIIDAARILNSLTDDELQELGLCPDTWNPEQTNDRLDRLFNRVHFEFAKGRTLHIGGEPTVIDAQWFSDRLIAASIPDDLPRSRAVAVDGTDIPTWGRLKIEPHEIEADGPAAQPPDTSTYGENS